MLFTTIIFNVVSYLFLNLLSIFTYCILITNQGNVMRQIHLANGFDTWWEDHKQKHSHICPNIISAEGIE